MAKLELQDGVIIVEYDEETGELIGVENWHGHEVHARWDRIAQEAIDQVMADKGK